VEVGYVNRVARLKTGNKRCSREPSSRLRSSDSRRALLPFLLDRSNKDNVFTAYADPKMRGLELRDYEQAYATVYSGYDERELHLRWCLNRPGHRPLDLGDDIDAPDEARRYARGLLDGREDAIVNAYIDNSPDIERHDCSCFDASELLMDKTLEEIEAEVKDSRWFLARAEKDLAVARRYACLLMQKRCRLRKRCLSAMGNSANARGLRFESKRNRQSG
jgi:hypothetical protein